MARDVGLGSYLESFLVFAVAAILVIRTFLALTGYPQLGGGGIHIAHMLWGGLIMLASIVLLLVLVGSNKKLLGAILAGIGFGTFIDELGKFITSDNNYFYQPTIALIYILFIVLFLLFREISGRRRFSNRELLANSAERVVDALVVGATQQDIDEALSLLRQSGAGGEQGEAIRRSILAAPRVEDRPPGLVARLAAFLNHAYSSLVMATWFQGAVVALFVAHAVGFVVVTAWLLLGVAPAAAPVDERSFAALARLVGAIASSLLIVIGVIYLPRSRLAAYVWFKRGILVSIFFVQVFVFYTRELGAIGGLALDLLLYGALSYMIGQEQARTSTSEPRQVASRAEEARPRSEAERRTDDSDDQRRNAA